MDPSKRLIRKEILRTLRYAGRIGANSRLLYQSLADAGYPFTPVDVEEHLSYLAGEGKEYIELRELKVEGMADMRVAVLLPRGVDLREGNIEFDPGIAE